MTTQRQAIFEALRRGRSITPLDALREFRCFRLAAHIHELRREGHDIATVIESDGRKRWARYSLVRLKHEHAA